MLKQITQSIRLCREYSQLIDSVKRQRLEKGRSPFLVTGLSKGASDAFFAEATGDVREICGAPALILVSEERDAVRLRDVLTECGVRTLFFPDRDLNLYNAAASHEFEHERLKVLCALHDGSCDAIVTVPDAVLRYTIPILSFRKK